MSNKVLKVKFKDAFSNSEMNKRIEFPNHFDDLIKWCQTFIEISDSEQYEFIEDSTKQKVSNDSEFQLIKNQINSKVIKFLLKIVKKEENSNFNLIKSINVNNSNNSDDNNYNNNFNKNEFENFESSESKKLYSLKNDSLNKNENINDKKEEISKPITITEKEENSNNSNDNNNYNIISENNINKSHNENNIENNFENEIDSVNSKIKESISILVKEKMKKFEDELINEIYKNVSLNSSKLIEQSKINSSLSVINTNNINNLPIHNNIKCSICNEIIKGELFKCSKCKDFNLCSNCEEFNNHDESHIFIKIRNPKDDKIELNEIPQYKK